MQIRTTEINIILVLILLVVMGRGEYASQLDKVLNSYRREIVDRSLRGYWKLSDDSNFRINTKITMINQQSEKKRRTSSMLNFFAPTNGLRQADTFFEAPQRGKEATGLYLKLYDGKYNENATVIVQIDLQPTMQNGVQSDGKYILWSNTKQRFVTCLLLRDREIIGRFSVGMAVQIVINIKQNQPIDSATKIDIKFESSSFSFRAFFSPIVDEYNTFVYLAAACTAMFTITMLFEAKKSVYNLSEWMIVQVAAFVVATSFIFLSECLQKLDTNLKSVAICAIGNIVLSLCFLRKYDNVISNEFNNRNKKIQLLLFSVVYFTLVIVFKRNLVFWIYEGFILFAVQINYSYSLGGKGGMRLALVLTIIFTRLPFIYYRYYLQSLTREPDNVRMLIVFIGISTIMLIFTTLQRYFGSRFIIPNELIPDYFNYYKKIERGNQKLEETCSICAQPYKQNPQILEPEDQKQQQVEDEEYGDGDGEEQNREQQNREQQNREQQEREKKQRDIAAQRNVEQDNFVVLMITPCEHEFHPKCLQDWMDKRLNCPMCRTELPPSERQRDDSYCC